MGDILSRQSSNIFSKRIDVPGESVAERLSGVIDHINATATSWYDGQVDSVDKRMDLVRQAITLARQARSGQDVTASTLSAIEIENSLERLYSMLGVAREELTLTEVDLPQYSVHASPA